MPNITEWMYYPPISRFSMPYFFGTDFGRAIHIKTAFWSVFVNTTPDCPHISASEGFYIPKRKLVETIFSFQRQFT